MKHLTNQLNQWLIIVLFSVLVMVPGAELKAAATTDTSIDSSQIINYAISLTPTITIPKTGTIWVKSATKTITWNKLGTQCANVKIYLYRGTVKILAIAKTTANDGTYDWPIPSTLASAVYKIWISTLDGSIKVKSAAFYIVTGLIQVTQPAAGSIWQSGSGVSHIITWTMEGKLLNTNVKIELLKGTTIVSTLAATTSNDGSFEWNNPKYMNMADNYKIRITTKDNLVMGKSGFFSIVQQASVMLLAPNGNEVLKPTVSQAIRWTADPKVLEVKLEFSRNNGSSFTTIANHVPNTGRYDWLVPVNFTRNAIVRVSDSNGKPWMNEGLLECNFKFNYSGDGEEPGVVFWFGGIDPQAPGYGFAKIEIDRDRVHFGGFTKSIEPLTGAWHEVRVRFNFNRDTVEIRLDNQILFENAALNTTQEYYFQPNLVLHTGGNMPTNFTLDDLTINVVQQDGAGNDQQLFNVLTDNFDRYDERSNALQNCWQWKNMNDRGNKVELNVENRDNKSLRLLTETGKQLLIYLPFNLLDRVPFDISDKNMVITNQ